MKTIRVALAVSLFLALAGGVAAQDPVWQISYEKSGLLADVRLNGYPVYRFSNIEDQSGILMIGPWLKKDRNELVIMLSPKPAGQDAPANDQRSFAFSLFTLQRGDPDATRNEIFRVKLPLTWTDSLDLPKRLEFSIYLDNPPAVALWDSAQSLGPEAVAEARELMGQVFDALRAKDADAYFELLRWALEDTYTAHGWNTAEYIDKAKATLPDIFQSPDFQLGESDPAKLIYESVTGARDTLLAVRGIGGKPAIDAGALSQETLFLARIDGKLTIVRN